MSSAKEFDRFATEPTLPQLVDMPTGLGKTAMACWDGSRGDLVMSLMGDRRELVASHE